MESFQEKYILLPCNLIGNIFVLVPHDHSRGHNLFTAFWWPLCNYWLLRIGLFCGGWASSASASDMTNKGVHPMVTGNISSIFTSRSTVGVSTVYCGRLVVICRLLQENSSVRVNYDTDGNVQPQTYNAACTSIELWIIIPRLEHRLMREYNGRIWLVTRLPRSTVTAKRGPTSDMCNMYLKKCWNTYATDHRWYQTSSATVVQQIEQQRCRLTIPVSEAVGEKRVYRLVMLVIFQKCSNL